jgi:pilus assembly protein FimV
MQFKLKHWLVGAALVGVPFSLSAAGLGRLTVQSALGQPLQAEIDLVNVGKDELAGLSAHIASPDTFREANLEYAPALANVKFTVEHRANGQPYLKLVSPVPLNEPFLDMLIELTWASGKLLREYPVLLDPPGYANGKSAPAAQAGPAPAAPAAPAVTSAPVAEPTRAKSAPDTVAKAAEPTRAPEPAAKAPEPAAEQAPAEAPAAKSAAPKAAAKAPAEPAPKAPAAEPAKAAEESYTVKRGDTLHQIAEKVRGDGVTIDQMMIALFQQNRQAFLSDNLNRVRAGAILRVPPRAVAAEIEPAEATREVKVQLSNWQAYRQKLAGEAAAIPVKRAEASQSASGKVATVEDKAVPKPAPGESVLRVSPGEAPGKKGVAGAGRTPDQKGLQERLSTLEEEATAREKALQESSSRVAQLEKQIRDMQSLLALKAAPAAKETPKEAPKEAPAPEAAKVEAVKPEAPKAEAPKLPAAPPPKPPAAAVPPPLKPATETGVVEDLVGAVTENPMYAAGGVIALGAAAVLGLIAMRRRRERDFNSSFATGTGTISPMTVNTVTAQKASAVVDTGSSSFLSDFDKVNPGSMDAEEVDPVAEADVYIAYGRDAQAEEILKEAMAKDPSRHEIPLKLLEIYATRKSPVLYAGIAEKLHADLGGEGPVWAKVAETGRSIDPNNSLYGGKPAEAAAPASAATAAREVGEDLERTLVLAPRDLKNGLFDGSPNTQPGDAHGDALAAADPGHLDFDLGDDDALAPKPLDITAAGAAHADAGESVDLSLDRATSDPFALDFDLDMPDEVPAPTSTATRAPAELQDHEPKLDIALDSLDLTAPVKTDADHAARHLTDTMALPPADVQSSLGPVIDLSQHRPAGFNSSAPGGSPPAPAASGLDALALELDDPADHAATSGGDDGSGTAAKGAQWQNVATKLDLARAYLEIGDKEGAQEILKEVVQEGDPDQRMEANRLAAQVA